MFCFSAVENGLGRAFALWLAARELGWQVRVVTPPAAGFWPPLASEPSFLETIGHEAAEAAEWSDLLLALKPLPDSLGVAIKARRKHSRPLVVDIDDPDWEDEFGGSHRRQTYTFVVRTLHGRPPFRMYRLRRAAGRLPVLVSNPALRRWYPGAAVIPHARLPRPAGSPHLRRDEIEVAFVGSVRAHKGVEILREAASQAGGIRLTITGDAPADAKPHESWVGETSLAEGLTLIDHADVVAIPSHPWIYSLGQLPVKLIDAMMAGRAVVGSDLPPIRWALGGAGKLVPPGDVGALTQALDSLRGPETRTRLGERARARALASFTPAAVASELARALR
jgi:glycosyltransferase involved in cell wall biosynthesis